MSYVFVSKTPKMTSNTAPAPFVASASSQYNSGTHAYLVFNKESTGYWVSKESEINGAWIALDLKEEIEINAFEIRPYTFFTSNSLSLYASNDEQNFQLIKTFNKSLEPNTKYLLELDESIKFKSYKIIFHDGVSTNGVRVWLSSVDFGIAFKRNLVLKNPATNNHYSLAEKTLIPLPNPSDKNMILHGIESGKEIKLDEAFDKMKYVQDTSEVLGEGKIFTHNLDLNDIKINKIIL